MDGGVIHVGAWIGEEYAGADEGRLLLFEPQQGPFEALKANCPDALLVNAAAGAEAGEATLYRVEPDHSSSLLPPSKLRDGFDFDGEERVRMTTVDATVEGFSLVGMFDQLRIDTQGYELEVLKGAKRTLEDIQRVECELHDPVTYPGAASLEALDAYLIPLGFKRTEYETENSDDLGDAVYARC